MGWIKTVIFAIGVIAITILTGFAIAVWIPWCKMDGITCRLGTAEWAYWGSAIGAIGAWIGTIWIATTETRRRNGEARDRAKVAAAATMFHALRATQRLKKLLNAVSDKPGPNRRDEYERHEQTLRNVRGWQNVDIYNLIPLRNHVAANLAVAGSIIDDMIANMHRLQNPQSTKHLVGNTAFFKSQLEFVINSLEIVHTECVKFVGVIQMPTEDRVSKTNFAEPVQ